LALEFLVHGFRRLLARRGGRAVTLPNRRWIMPII
jgi:hypothetical protein